jgi:hypothetical protein
VKSDSQSYAHKGFINIFMNLRMLKKKKLLTEMSVATILKFYLYIGG